MKKKNDMNGDETRYCMHTSLAFELTKRYVPCMTRGQRNSVRASDWGVTLHYLLHTVVISDDVSFDARTYSEERQHQSK